MGDITQHADCRQAIAAIKQRIQASQTRAVLAVNAELLRLYWDIGRQLEAWQRERALGSVLVEQMAADLQASYPGMKDFSRSSLFAMRQFQAFFSPQFEVVPQPVGQMPWGHVPTLLAKVKSVEQVLLYARACSENGWSRTVPEWQIEQRFHERASQAVERDIENQLVVQCARHHRRSIVGSITVTDCAEERERASHADWRRREQTA